MLSADTLRAEVLKLTDSTDPNFVGFPETAEQTAANWAHAARVFFEELLAFVVLPGTHDIAEEAFHAASVATVSLPGAGAAALDSGFAAYAGALAAGVTPGTGAAVPPPGPLALATAIPLPVPTPGPPAAAIGAHVLAWASTGSFTPTGGSAIPWG